MPSDWARFLTDCRSCLPTSSRPHRWWPTRVDYPTLAILAMAPLLKGGLVEPAGIIFDSKSGVSVNGADAQADHALSGVQREFLRLQRRVAPPQSGNRSGAGDRGGTADRNDLHAASGAHDAQAS